MLKKQNMRSKLMVFAMAFVMLLTGVSFAMPTFADSTDANHDISQMSPSVAMEYKIDGSWRNQSWVESHYSAGSGVPSGTEIRFKLSFSPDRHYDYNPEDQLFYFPLSGVLNINPLTGTMKDGLVTAGAWSAEKREEDGNYVLVIDLDDDYITDISRNLANGFIMFYGKIKYTPGDSETMTVPFPGTSDIVIPIQKKTVKPVSLKIDKTKSNGGIYKGSDGNFYVRYKITVKNEGEETATNITVEDYPGMQDNSSDGNYNPVQKPNQCFALTDDGHPIITKVSGSGDFAYQDGKWVWAIESLAGGAQTSITYDIKLTNAVAERDVDIFNDAGVFYNGNYMHSDWEEAKTSADLTDYGKSLGDYHRRSDGKGVISYTVKVKAKDGNLSNLSNVKIHDYLTDKNIADYLSFDNLKIKVGGNSYEITGPTSGTNQRTWTLKDNNGVDQGGIVEKKDSSSRKYIEFTIKTLKPGEFVEFTYDLIIDDNLFANSQDSAESKTKNSDVTVYTSKKIGNAVQFVLGTTQKKVITKDKTAYKAWVTKNGKKIYNGFWEFNLKVNEPKTSRPALVSATSINKIADRLGTGWVYCGADESTSGSNAVVTIKKYPIINGGDSYDKTNPETVTVPLSEISQVLSPSDEDSASGKYASMWSWQDQGAYYYEVTYYAKRTDDNVSDVMSNSGGYDIGIGTDLKPFNHRADWVGSDDVSSFIDKEGMGLNSDNTRASWQVEIKHDVYSGWQVADTPESDYKSTIDRDSFKIGFMDNGTLVPLDSNRYSVSFENNFYTVTFNENISASKAAPLVITYDTVFDGTDIENAASGTRIRYKNNVTLKASDDNTVSATAEQSFVKPDYISKKSVKAENGIITWEIKVNSTGHMSGSGIVTDFIPAGTQYVEGSATVTGKGSSASGTQMTSAELIPANAEANENNDKLVMNFTGFNASGDDKSYVTIQLKTKITDPAFTMENVSGLEYNNAAELDYGGHKRAAHALVEVSNEALKKTSSARSSDHEIDYEVEVNKNAVDINPDGTTVKLIDEFDSNMMIKSDTITVEKYDGNNSWSALDPQPAASITDQKLTMEIPDNIRLRLKYTCYVFGESGDKLTLQNDIKFEGRQTVIHNPTGIILEDSEGGLDGVPSVKVKKVDASDNSKLIKNAEFSLYEITEDQGALVETQVGTVQKTGTNGMAVFKDLDKTKVYAFKEVKAPTGYIIDPRMIYFYFDKAAVTTAIQAAADAEEVTLRKIEKGFTFERTNRPTSVEVIKVDEDDPTKVLKNAHIQVLDKVNGEYEVVDEWDSEAAPHTVSYLEIGKVYYLKETIAPQGYTRSAITQFALKYDENGDAVVDTSKTTAGTINEDGVIMVLDAPVAENTDIKVIKSITNMQGESWGTIERTFYVALFSDEALTDRVSDILPIVFKNQSSSSAVFEEVSINKTYYIAEVDEAGTPIKNAVTTEAGDYIVDFGDYDFSKEISFYEAEICEEGETLVMFENKYFKFPDGFYKDGTISILKKVTDAEGNPYNVTDSFYVSAFSDEDCTQLAYGPAEVSLSNESEGTAQITEMALGKYWLAETDAQGNAVDETYDYIPVFDRREIEVTEENTEFSVTLTNKKPNDFFDLTKIVEDSKGKGKKVTGSFYVTVFYDEACTDIVKTVRIGFWKSKQETVRIDGLEPGTYYLAETDKNGELLGKKFDYVPEFSSNYVEIVREDLADDVTLTNKGKPGTDINTGDSTEIMLAVYNVLLMAVLVAVSLFVRKKIRNK